eukprot:6339117-Ditylum_brightwellii.AAC.2
MEYIWTETYWRIFNARGVALEGIIGGRKKKGVGPGRGRNCVKGSGAETVSYTHLRAHETLRHL